MQDPRREQLHDEPIGVLLRRLSEETTLLVRQELELAKTELTEKGKKLTAGASYFAAAAILGLGAFGALTACIILALSLAMPGWVAALIVTAMYAVVAAVIAMRGKQDFKEAAPLVPTQTVQTLKEDVEWAKTQTKSAAR